MTTTAPSPLARPLPLDPIPSIDGGRDATSPESLSLSLSPLLIVVYPDRKYPWGPPLSPRWRRAATAAVPSPVGQAYVGPGFEAPTYMHRRIWTARYMSDGWDLPLDAASQRRYVEGGKRASARDKMLRKREAVYREKLHRPRRNATPSCACVCAQHQKLSEVLTCTNSIGSVSSSVL